MKAFDIQRRLMADAYTARAFACQNYTPKGWFECDVFEIRKSGFTCEFEIKLSRSDFLADTKKLKRVYHWAEANTPFFIEEKNKHDCISKAVDGSPNYFSFVTPRGLLNLSDIPEWAGLIECDIRSRTSQFPVVTNITKPAPRLHKNKISDEVRNHFLRSFYHRYQHWFLFEKK